MTWSDVAKFVVLLAAFAASIFAPVLGDAALVAAVEGREHSRWRRKAPTGRVSVAFGSNPVACEIAPPEGYRDPARGPCVGGSGSSWVVPSPSTGCFDARERLRQARESFRRDLEWGRR